MIIRSKIIGTIKGAVKNNHAKIKFIKIYYLAKKYKIKSHL